MRPVLVAQLLVHVMPGVVLVLGVLEVRDRVVHFVLRGQLSDIDASIPVDRVPEGRMVHIKDTVTKHQHLVAYIVEVLNSRREPGHSLSSKGDQPVWNGH